MPSGTIFRLREEPVVQDWLGRFDWKLSERNLAPNPLHAMRHLPNVEAHAGKGESATGSDRF